MKVADVAVCVATSTLEIGVDIGGIDLIVIAEPPWSISSLLQRIGRGNRRDDVIHAAAIAASEAEMMLLAAMLELASTGALPATTYEADRSVCVQQIFSYLYQHPGGVSEAALVALVSALFSEEETVRVLEHLRRQDWVEWRTGRWFASSRLMDMGETGIIHSNIPDSRKYKVFDVDTGIEVGTVIGVFDDVFALGRGTWRVESVDGDVIKARRFKGRASAPLFQKHRGFGAFHRFLPPELQD